MNPGATNSVRIVGGEYRSRVLHFPDAAGLRPTPDRVRETLFNWLDQRLHGLTCLDAFAGSGALGFEAASRGAERVVMLELDRRVHDALRQNATLLRAGQVEILRNDARAFISSTNQRFDIIFLDPPFSGNLLMEVLPLAATLLKPDGRIYAESPQPLGPVERLTTLRQGRAGLSHYCLLERA